MAPPRKEDSGIKHACGRHAPGTPACYTHDRCRCAACLRAATDRRNRERHHTIYRRHGVVDKTTLDLDLVDAESARLHLIHVMMRGTPWREAARLSGVPESTVSAIIYGRHRDDPSHPGYRPQRKRITRQNRDAILALKPVPRTGSSFRVDGLATRRRLRALAWLGWSNTQLGARLGVHYSHVGEILRGGTSGKVQESTELKVAQLYNLLWNTPPVPKSKYELGAITRTKKLARDNGWLPPMAWDDDRLGDPRHNAYAGKAAA